VSSTLPEQPSEGSTRSVISHARDQLKEQLKGSAVRLCRDGWPVLPLRYPEGDRLLTNHGPGDPETAAEWWSDQPYGIACRTGELFDVLQVPPWLGQRLLPGIEHYASVIEVPRSSLEIVWLLPVTPGNRRIDDLPRDCNVELRGHGDWIVLPPTPTLGGAARWVSHQEKLRLPHSLNTQWAAVRALSAARRERAAAEVKRRRPGRPPRHLATSA
jgi:Bifunctional DNA primase/polymerase, N-terminal